MANVASSYYTSKQGPTSLARRGNKAGAACTAFVQNFYVYSAGVEEGRKEERKEEGGEKTNKHTSPEQKSHEPFIQAGLIQRETE